MPVAAAAGENGSGDEVAGRVCALAEPVLALGLEAQDLALQRAGAQLLAAAACVGTTGFAAGLVRRLAREMAESPSAPRCARSGCADLGSMTEPSHWQG